MELTVKNAPAETPAPAAAPAPKPADARTALVDALGRRLVLKELDLLEETDVYAALGGENVDNKAVASIALMCAQVCEIDGDYVKTPATSRELRAVIKRVGRAGVQAIQAHFAPKPADGEAAPDDEIAEAKNS